MKAEGRLQKQLIVTRNRRNVWKKWEGNLRCAWLWNWKL